MYEKLKAANKIKATDADLVKEFSSSTPTHDPQKKSEGLAPKTKTKVRK